MDEKKKTYSIELHGLNDDTWFQMELTTPEFEFLQRIAEKANEASFGFGPTMKVQEIKG